MFQLSRRPLTCLLVCSSALALSSALLGACSGAEADGDPEFDGIEGYGGPQNPSGSGATNTPGQPTGQNSGATNTGSTNSGSNTGSTGNNTSPTPNTNPTNPTTPNSEVNPSTTPINNGTNTGNNAGTNTGNNGGAIAPGAGGAGSGMGTTPGITPTPPVTPVPPVITPVVPPVVTPSAPDIPCPNGATFCFGFESDALPAGASDQSQPTTPLQFDTTVKHSGNRSLKVVSAGGFNMRQVITPIPGQSFWVRLFVQTSSEFGDNDHDSLFVASTASPSQDNNAEHGPEFSEQGNQIVLNADDQLFSAAGRGFPQGEGPSLSANTWHCEEAFYDGGTGDTQFFHNGEEIINAAGFTRLTYQTFRFGYIGFNTVRTVWFDDVVVSPNRVNCD